MDIFNVSKKIILVTDHIDRLNEDTKALSRTITDHEIRLVRIETTLDIAQRPSRLTLPGK